MLKQDLAKMQAGITNVGEAGAKPHSHTQPATAVCKALARVPAAIANARARSVAAPIANREPQKSTAEGRKCGQLFSGRARGRRAVGYFLRSTFDLPTESPKIIG